MENTMINRFIPLIILLVAGCETHTTHFVLDTNPQGATIVCDGESLGYAPIYYTSDTNASLFGGNRAITEKDIAMIMELTKIKRGELNIGENKILTDERTINEIRDTEAIKAILGELKLGENTVLSDEDLKGFIEATKIVDGELKFSEYTTPASVEKMQELIEFVKYVKEMEYSVCTAYWSSGVSKKYPFSPAYRYVGDGDFAYTLQRPDGAGYVQDAEFALRVKQLNRQIAQDEQNAKNARLNALIAHRAAQSQESAASAKEYQNNKPITCHTSFGTTTCY